MSSLAERKTVPERVWAFVTLADRANMRRVDLGPTTAIYDA
jgi:hypothetical protein